MAGARKQSKPTFIWQAILILLPVIVLAWIGSISLHKDMRLARHEAASRAQAVADDLAPRLWNEIATRHTDGSNQISFRVDARGNLLFPPAYAPLPVPSPLEVKKLSAEQLRLWMAVQNSIDPEEVCEDFLKSDPPENFAAAACYITGLSLGRERKFLEAVEMFGWILEKYPNALGESGIPLVTLARFKLLELGPWTTSPPDWNTGVVHQTSGPKKPVHNTMQEPDFPAVPLKYAVSMDSFCSNIVNAPNALTPRFLNLFRERMDEEDAILAKGFKRAVRVTLPEDMQLEDRFHDLTKRSKSAEFKEARATVRKWERIWEDHESARQLYSAARETFRTNAALLFPLSSLTNEPGAAARQDSEPAGRSLSETNGLFSNDLTAHLFWFDTPDWKPLPVNAATNIQIANRNWLAVRFDEDRNSYWFVCRDEFQVGSWLSELMEMVKHIPDYFGVAIEVAGRRVGALTPGTRLWHYRQKAGGKAGGGSYKFYPGEDASTVLASAAQFEQGIEQLKVNVYLTSPSAHFRDQRSRAVWFGLLMATATAAALIGLFTAYRAFHRQLRLNEMKSNFVSSVSHELRAPIASVRLMAESLERGKVQEPAKQHEYFRFIVQECRRLSSLIENVLDFSRIEQGRKQYDLEPTDLAALTRRTVALMETYAAEHQVRLECVLPDTPVSASVDGKAIQQALVNLIDNAVKHSPNDSLVRIGLEPGGDLLQLWVEDQGEGIPPDEQEKIFERFYRLGSELRRETTGVGIGLSIVKHIVEAHDGKIIVRSAVGLGSRFTIEIPNENGTSNH